MRIWQTRTGARCAYLTAIGWLGLATLASADARHVYQVRVSPGLDRLEVEARLDGPVRSLAARDRDARYHLRDPRRCETNEPLSVWRGRIRLDGREDSCVRYEYRIDRPLPGRAAMGLSGIVDRLTSPSAWLWRPPFDDRAEYRVHFALPPGVQASVPWEPLDEHGEHAYRFGPSPGGSDALAAFGAFDYREIEIPGAVLRVSFLRGTKPVDHGKLARWVRTAASNVTLAYGRYPNPSPQVLVVPVDPRGGSAVPFGRVLRDGGEAVQFFVDPTRPLSELLDDWTATHEFSHLMLPYVRERWISEGFATYYQNVLLARAGIYGERRAWQKLHEGFERGRRSVPGTSPNDARMGGGGVMKIYWSGAAVALLADLALRRESGGRESLDTVLEQLAACCLPSERSWGGRELFARMDRFASHPVLMDLYNRYADRPGFPDLEPIYDQLGIELRGNRVRLSDHAPAADIRRRIMSRR